MKRTSQGIERALAELDRLEKAGIEPVQEPWAVALRRVLESRRRQLAAADPGQDPPAWVRPDVEPGLPGEECQKCGYADVRAADAEAWVADCLVPFHVGDGTLLDAEELVATILARELIGTEDARTDLLTRTTASGVQLSPRMEPLSRCPACGSEDVAACVWNAAGGGLHPLDTAASTPPTES